jgi:hypothetical protein
MESWDYFTFRNRAMLYWLGIVFAFGLVMVLFFPPAFWLCTLGILFLVVGLLAHSARTGQWYTWQNWEPSLSWFEGWLVVTGSILMVAQLIAVILRARFSL